MNKIIISKDELLEKIKDYYNKNGKSPTSTIMKNPSSIIYYKVFGTQKWNEILTIAGLPINHKNYYSDDEGYQTIKNLYDQLGKLPTRQDLRDYNCVPTYEYYYKKFGTLKNAYYNYGLIEKPLSDNERIQISINELEKLANILNKCPTVAEYEAIKHRGFVRRVLERKLGLKYNNICRKYIPQYALNFVSGELTQDDISKEIKRIADVIKRPPMYYELRKYGCGYSYNLIQRVFNGLTYNQVIESFGWKPSGSTTLSKSEDELLEDFEKLFYELQRIPTYFDLDNNKTASFTTYRKYFGNIKNVCDLLKIDCSSYSKCGGIGFRCFDMDGGLCKSIPECEITNYYIINNIKYLKEPHYDELIYFPHKRFDWKIYINNRYYYVEYFGMYSKTNNSPISRRYYKNVKKKIGKLYKAGVIDQCIFIFPNDLKTKTLDEIFAPYFNKINVA